MVAEQFAFAWTAWLFVRCDWGIAVVVNAVLGVELLQRAGRELCPAALGRSPWMAWSFDSVSAALGLWGLARQLRVASKVAAPMPRFVQRAWQPLREQVSGCWKVCGHHVASALEHLDTLLCV